MSVKSTFFFLSSLMRKQALNMIVLLSTNFKSIYALKVSFKERMKCFYALCIYAILLLKLL